LLCARCSPKLYASTELTSIVKGADGLMTVTTTSGAEIGGFDVVLMAIGAC
jgi:hypothetical protein